MVGALGPAIVTRGREGGGGWSFLGLGPAMETGIQTVFTEQVAPTS